MISHDEWHKAINADSPKYGERVLILTTDADGDPVHELAHFNGKLGYLGTGGKRIKPVSHWMKLPEVPTGENRMREYVITAIRNSSKFTAKLDSGEDVPILEHCTDAELLDLFCFYVCK